MTNQIALSCHLLQDIDQSYRVLAIFPFENIKESKRPTEKELYQVQFGEEHFDGKMQNILNYLPEADSGKFFSELVYMGFKQVTFQYTREDFRFIGMELHFSSESPILIRGIKTLEGLLSEQQISDLCEITIGYGQQFRLGINKILASKN